MSQNEAKSKAWLLKYNNNRAVAISVHAMQELIFEPELQELPYAPDYCRHLYHWNDLIIPVMNLTTLICDKTETSHQILIVAFKQITQIRFGAFQLNDNPELIEVSDNDFCRQAEQSDLWSQISLSCFRNKNKEIPILDLAKLFLTPNIKATIVKPTSH